MLHNLVYDFFSRALMLEGGFIYNCINISHTAELLKFEYHKYTDFASWSVLLWLPT